MLSRAFLINPGDFLLSHTVTRAVPSAPTGLTSVFGMGTSHRVDESRGQAYYFATSRTRCPQISRWVLRFRVMTCA
jgi:hypothetical protein